jgi:hypothetical protein
VRHRDGGPHSGALAVRDTGRRRLGPDAVSRVTAAPIRSGWLLPHHRRRGASRTVDLVPIGPRSPFRRRRSSASRRHRNRLDGHRDGRRLRVGGCSYTRVRDAIEKLARARSASARFGSKASTCRDSRLAPATSRRAELERAAHAGAGPPRDVRCRLSSSPRSGRTIVFTASGRACSRVGRRHQPPVPAEGGARRRRIHEARRSDAASCSSSRRVSSSSLVNCALFTEGFDVPRVACISMGRPTTSRGLYAQYGWTRHAAVASDGQEGPLGPRPGGQRRQSTAW